MNHKHNDGWLLDCDNEEILLDEEIEVIVRCNHIGCITKRKVKVICSEIQ